MILKTYQSFITKKFINTLLKITLIFYSLVFIMNIFEEINFLKNSDTNFYLPIILTFLNSPSVLYEIFPFIFLISTQFFYMELIDKNELLVLKNHGVSNFQVLKMLLIISALIALIINVIFYNISSNLKFLYLDLKNDFAKDNKYLAVITENGLWIKDEINNKINIINAEKIIDNELLNVEIIQFNNNFIFEKTIVAEKVNVEEYEWKINNAKVSKDNFNKSIKKDLTFQSNFNSEKINNLFSNLSSLTFFELRNTKKNYGELGYSTSDIDTHIQKIFAYPFYLIIMTLFSSIIMINIKHNKPKIFNLTLGILLSVVIYYINYFSAVLGQNLSLPVSVAVWSPMLIIFLACSIGLVRINEK
jgi:lipopolysaccharide export system permease protein